MNFFKIFACAYALVCELKPPLLLIRGVLAGYCFKFLAGGGGSRAVHGKSQAVLCHEGEKQRIGIGVGIGIIVVLFVYVFEYLFALHIGAISVTINDLFGGICCPRIGGTIVVITFGYLNWYCSYYCFNCRAELTATTVATVPPHKIILKLLDRGRERFEFGTTVPAIATAVVATIENETKGVLFAPKATVEFESDREREKRNKKKKRKQCIDLCIMCSV